MKQPTRKPGVRSLTEREFQIFQLAASGYQNAKLAGKLRISVKTVESHKRSILIKLGVTTTAELMSKYARRYGIKKVK